MRLDTLAMLGLMFTALGGCLESSDDLGVTDPWTEVTGPSYINNATVISYVLPAGSTTKLFVRLRVTSP